MVVGGCRSFLLLVTTIEKYASWNEQWLDTDNTKDMQYRTCLLLRRANIISKIAMHDFMHGCLK